jgi:putative ABC transport system permease protein
MRLFKLAWKNTFHDKLGNGLSILLIAFSFALIVLVSAISTQAESDMKRQIRTVDMVIGAKGSPLQLILSAVYHADKPTGNISVAEAKRIQKHPLVQESVPLSYGDNVDGFRIVGTTYTYLDWYKVDVAKGRKWEKAFEVTVGSEVAKELNLALGDELISSHGLAGALEQHESHPYVVTGILAISGTPLDRLILTDLRSIWEAHADHGSSDKENEIETDETPHNHEHEHSEDDGHIHDEESEHNHNHSDGSELASDENQQYTAVLIKFRSLAGMMQLPRFVNEQTNMQAAVPQFEVNRLFDLIGNGAIALQSVGLIMLFLAAISLFIQLYRSFSSRRYEMALMRIYGASSLKVAIVIIYEALLIGVIGAAFGLILTKIGSLLISLFPISQVIRKVEIQWLSVSTLELQLLLAIVCIALIAAVLPIIQNYRMDISKTLSE